MKRTIPLYLLATMCCMPATAAEKHDHGAGQISVAIDGARIDIDLELPLDTVVGFERAPRTDKERAALAAAGKSLQDGAALFVPTAAAQCALKAAEIELPYSGAAAAKSSAVPASSGAQHEAEGHADVDARYTFECAQPAALAGIETRLFKTLPRLYRLELQRVGPKGQGGGRLTPKDPVVRW